MHERNVTLSRANGAPMDAFLALPEEPRPPVVLIVHEIFGLNDNIRDIAQRFAREGYAGVAVDLFSHTNRALCLMRTIVGMLARPLDNAALADLQAAVDWIQGQPDLDGDRIGVIGFCMGGGLALALACTEGDLAAVSAFYGVVPPADAFDGACPVAGSFGKNDPQLRGAAPKLEAILTRHNVPHDVKEYPNAGHAFFNQTSKLHEPEAARDSWGRTLAFFATHVRGNTVSEPVH